MDVTIPGRYLADQLSAEERAEYETFLCAHPEAVRELEAVARLKVGLASLQKDGQLERLLPLARKSGARRFLTPPALALAASIAALAVGVTLWRAAVPQLAPLAPTLAALQQNLRQPLSLGSRVMIMRTRAAGDDAVIELPQAEQAIELRVLPDVSAEPAGFSVELSKQGDDQSRQAIARGGPMHAAADGFLSIYADAEKLPAGVYQLTLTPLGGDAVNFGVQSFRIRVRSR